MTFAVAEDWLVAVIKDVMNAIGASDVSVLSGPGAWDGAFTRQLLEDLPAVVVTLDGGENGDGTSVRLAVTWTLHVITGWQGQDEEFRRRGTAAIKGAYAILEALIVPLAQHEHGRASVHRVRYGPCG